MTLSNHLELKKTYSINSNKLLIQFIDYLFWILFFLYTNPGGIFESINLWHVIGRININDVIFVLLTCCYILIPKSKDIYDKDFIKIKNYLLFFLIYYFVVFVYLVPLYKSDNYSLTIAITKSRWVIYTIFIFIYSYTFFKRRWDIFLWIFLISSITVLFLFLFGVITGFNILPLFLQQRGFVNLNRLMLFSYGIMFLIIPLGAAAIVFKLKVKYKNLILLAFFLMSIGWILSITRRHILSIIIYFTLAFIINSFIEGQYKILFKYIIKGITIFFFVTIISYFVFPKYVEAAKIGIIETINIVQKGKESTGQKDERIVLRPFIVNQFLSNPVFGTGFDDRWRNSEGDKQGYEASDYPFLSALAMFGITGILIFLPVYILLIKILYRDIRYLRKYKNKSKNFFFIFLMTFILFFIFHLMQYFNYFIAVSRPEEYLWYFALSLYLGSRYLFYSSEKGNQKFQPNFRYS